MEIKTFVVGMLETNCYLVYGKDSKVGFLIDPGVFNKKILDAVKKEGIHIKNIINTHGHPDHTGGNIKFGYPVLVHEADKGFLTAPPERCLKDGDIIKETDIELEVIHTPGHTPGGISLKAGNKLFTGDTLFQGGVGRTDFPYSDGESLLRSIRERLMVLGDEVEVLPGHGPGSTIGRERKNFE
jgi:glyoxylase-like metal-dependent hydrolase (beta-lactamase superfamily II)